TNAPTTTIDPLEARTIEQVNEYIAQAAAFDQVGADAQFPEGLTFSAGGAPGYSRYVFREHSGGVVPTLVEGPLDGTVRCQDEALPCSYLELRELLASGAPIPPELQMSPEELSTLVAQLDELNTFAEAHRDVNSACAAGFVSDQIQSANMGSHFYQPQWLGDGFFPSRPEILLYARADGQMPTGALGQCVDGVWTGEPMELVGTSFIIPPQVIGNTHPETFAGPLDNWHIHYNLCRGNSQGRDTFIPQSECEAAGGNFSAALGWMIHAWVDPAHDNQLGVFSMWNSSITPVMDAATILETRQSRGSDFPAGAQQSLITDFLYTGELDVGVGQPLFFNNVDSVPHTVSAGTPDAPDLDDFDSGLLTPGSNFEVTFDTAGTYSLFCTLHPDMVATVTVTP
ncbi:MAG: plastocyanin/azurin family copper-binding protein, partial [Ilumatobacteraceae bacterium]